MQWQNIFSDRSKYLEASAFYDSLELTVKPDTISFGCRFSDPETFIVEEFQEENFNLFDDLIKEFQNNTTEGYHPLRRYLANYMTAHGTIVRDTNILMTNDAQHAIDLIGKTFVNDHVTICIENPICSGTLKAWNVYGANYCTVPVDDNGLILDSLPKLIEMHGPKFIYTMPNFQNPTGISLSIERRYKLLEIATKYKIFIVEDDRYGDMRFEGEELPTLISLAPERVVYVGSFSATLAPGINIGWICAPVVDIAQLVGSELNVDIDTNLIAQIIANKIYKQKPSQHFKSSMKLNWERRDAMLSAIDKFFPVDVKCTKPQGGIFLWIETPERVNTLDLLNIAIEEKVNFMPGIPFYNNGSDGTHRMRLNFSYYKPSEITEGIRRLGNAMNRLLTSHQ